ncbi:MAG: hypothetical protein AAFX79_05045 [Planctomycetota bacterium]
MIGLRTVALLAALLVLACGPTRGQDSTPADESTGTAGDAVEAQLASPVTVLLDIGYAGVLPGGAWAPVRAVLTGGDDPVQGVLRLRVPVSADETMIFETPAATTPGRETIVPFAAWIPQELFELSIEFVDARGRPIAGSRYTRTGEEGTIRLTATTPASVMHAVASPSLRTALTDIGVTVSSAIPRTIGGAPWIPGNAIAYDGLDALVVDGQRGLALEQPNLRAMREWLAGGGCLVVANADELNIEAILGPLRPEGLSIGQPEDAAVPGIEGARLVRPIRLSPLPAGWTGEGDLGGGRWVYASGPVGMGWLVLSAYDPDFLADDGLRGASIDAWRGVLRTVFESGRAQRFDQAALGDYGPTRDERATLLAYDKIGEVPPVGLGIAGAIFLLVLGLAVMVGLGDRLLLRRLHATSKWWLTSLAWIGVASVAAYWMPSLVRDGPTLVTRLRVVDVHQPAGVARVQGMAGVFLNQPRSIEPADRGRPLWLSPQANPYEYRVARGSATGGFRMRPTAGGYFWPQPIRSGIWTLTTLREQGVAATPASAEVTRENGALRLRLSGIDADRLLHAAVRTGGRWCDLERTTPANNGRDLVFTPAASAWSEWPPRVWTPRTDEQRSSRWWRPEEPLSRGLSRPGELLGLPDASTRTPALDALSDDDGWAVVHLHLRDEEPGSIDAGDARHLTHTICRIAVPVRGDAASGADP